ncbi:uncharacterized protein LOC113769992 isoform X1 [Coffea eugenioides]|uniref:uncharacterized protein LOC113769992 isoform X1 n=2 Tax=Coffea eugenioides TaxID=49369 RepID=UPI000F60ACBC|nr:uncharacterized protein LOC113769992 isoform X1 [Coffea eugenioides]
MSTVVAHGPLISFMPMKFSKGLRQEFSNSKFSLSKSNPLIFRCCSNKDEKSQESQMGFSVLKKDVECDRGIIYSTMAFYVFSLHIPLSFGGLAIVATILHQEVIEPQTEALALLGLEILEFIGFVLLLKRPGEPQYKLLDLFQVNELAAERSWLLASLIGFLFLLFLLLVTSLIADQFLGTKEVNNPILQALLSSGSISVTACILVYCIVTPFLEEIVYRGYLLTSLSCTMKWQQAVLLSSLLFSASHFSAENFLQLFVIGCVLGCSYCWSGNLSSSVLVHSLYNAFILYITYIS